MSYSIAIELFHAVLMCAFVGTVPLLFLQHWPRLTACIAAFDVLFIIVNRASHYLLGECVFTRMARQARWATGDWNEEWFTVKLCRVVFGLIPANRQVVLAEQTVILVVAVGVFYVWWRRR